MDELNFNDEVHLPKQARPHSSNDTKSEQRRIRKPHKLREIEMLLEKKQLQDQLCDLLG